jgi:hypothetical protein
MEKRRTTGIAPPTRQSSRFARGRSDAHRQKTDQVAVTPACLDELPEGLRDPLKALERGRELLAEWGPTPITDAAVLGKKPLGWFQQHRLEWIAETLRVFGYINRGHIERKFGISIPQASLDLRRFQERFPDVMRYDSNAKHYCRIES